MRPIMGSNESLLESWTIPNYDGENHAQYLLQSPLFTSQWVINYDYSKYVNPDVLHNEAKVLKTILKYKEFEAIDCKLLNWIICWVQFAHCKI